MASASDKLSYRVNKAFERHFYRSAREVLIFGDPNKVDCPDCIFAGPLGGSVSECQTCNGEGYIISDSSVCMLGIVASAEPRNSINKGVIERDAAGTFHHEAYYVVFRLKDAITDPIANPNRTIFELTGEPKLGWSGHRYDIKSYARDGLGSEDNYVKVLVYRSE